MSEFWEKVDACEHPKDRLNYIGFIGCPTPYCSGDEWHCLDCGVCITECGCHYNDGMSGWSLGRWKTEEKRQRNREEVA